MTIERSDIKVTAIVVTYNSCENIRDCLKALSREICLFNGEIIVFDNFSEDDTADIVKREYPHVRFIAFEKNIGFGAANNVAAKEAVGDYILMANPDMILDVGALRIMIESFEKLPDCGAIVARLKYPDGTFQPTCRNFPNSTNIFFSRGSVLNPDRWGGRHNYTIGDFGDITEVPAASAACMLIKREFFLKIGGFDTRFFLFMEDTDLSLRINQAGGKIYFVPKAEAVHFWGKGSKISRVRRSWYHHISVWKYYLKHYPGGFSLFLLPMALGINFLVRSVTGYDPQ